MQSPRVKASQTLDSFPCLEQSSLLGSTGWPAAVVYKGEKAELSVLPTPLNVSGIAIDLWPKHRGPVSPWGMN